MEKARHFPFAILQGVFVLTVLVLAQDQSGFISIDCGMSGDSYEDETTGINYVSDAAFIDTGVSKSISSKFNSSDLARRFWNVRSFPEGTKNCYTLKPAQGRNNKYLIRAGFMYGNYDGRGQVPEFDLYLGPNYWDQVILDNPGTNKTSEIIHLSSSDRIHVCLVNTGFGTPFISYLELRLLDNNTYITESGTMELFVRLDCGLAKNQTVRFPDDIYDRIWTPYDLEESIQISTSSQINSLEGNNYNLPSKVMQTAVTPVNSSIDFGFGWVRDDPTSEFYIFLHFAEIQELKANLSRQFNIYLHKYDDETEELWYGPFAPKYLSTTTVRNTSAKKGMQLEVMMNKTGSSILLPLINAFEVYLVKPFSQSETNQEDVDAVLKIKSKYEVKRYWQGDPCSPRVYIWDGLNCSFDGPYPPRIISLNLSSSGLTGEISSYISNLRMLKYLDLSKNSLTGPVPDFLSQLPFLRVLNLEGNKLSGFVPEKLIKRSENGTLLLSVDKNRNLCAFNSCKKKSKYIAPVVVSTVVILIILLAALAIILTKKRRKQVANGWKVNNESDRKNGESKSKELQFEYNEILKITNNFEKVVSEGEFGKVYYGFLDDTQVAVKMFTQSSVQGYNQFQAEAKQLMRVHHRNLLTIIGYCDEGTYQGLVYEFMANGNLNRHLSDESTNFLSWEERLRIAIDAAQGLGYLHYGVKPPIVHGNLKSTNILLNAKFQVKLVDFGFSRIFPTEAETDVSTDDAIKTGIGYLDPEYNVSKRLNKKSDVYSFGVLLLEIITSQPVIAKTHDKTHIIQWTNSMLARGDIENIVDQRLKGDFGVKAVWKAVDTAMACVNTASVNRPTMSYVVMELKECLAIEKGQKKEIGHETDSKESIEMPSLNPYSDTIPLAR